MLLSIVVPCYNEENTILEVLERIYQVPLEPLGIKKEVIVVDDASTDSTWEILKNAQKKYSLKLLRHEKNMGKGWAIRTAIKEVTGDIVVIQDADLEYNPQDYPKLLEPIISGKAKVVYGSRNLQKNPRSSFFFYWGGKFLSFLTNFLYGTKITDEATCYKALDTKLLKSLNLECKRFEFCPELTTKIAKRGYAIYEVPISYSPRSIKEGKKIRWRDGMEAAWTLIKYRFHEK